MRNSFMSILLTLVILTCLVPTSSPAQTAPGQSKQSTSHAARKPAPSPDFVLDGDTLTLTFDKGGALMSLKDPYPAPTPDSDHDVWNQQIWLWGGFKTPKGCNSWFAEAAIFILDQSWTISVPSPAHCPLPPRFRALPLWMIEAIANSSAVTLQLDGKVYPITVSQMTALREFAKKYSPDETWRSVHEPYARQGLQFAVGFAMSLFDKYAPGYPNLFPGWSHESSFADRGDSGVVRSKITAQEGGEEEERETFNWQELAPSGFGVDCQNSGVCFHKSVKGLSDSSFEDSIVGVMGEPFIPRQEPAMFDWNRVLAYMWYQHTFINVNR